MKGIHHKNFIFYDHYFRERTLQKLVPNFIMELMELGIFNNLSLFL